MSLCFFMFQHNNKNYTPVHITTKDGKQISFFTEVVSTPAEYKKGLMFRKSLDENKGMLFKFNLNGKDEKQVFFWMKNTLIPLDIIFISKNGTIKHIAKNTEPLSTKLISSKHPVSTVLEINAGLSDKLNINISNKVKIIEK